MIVCRLCGLTIEAIPDDAIQVGKLYRFSNGEYHYLRKKPEPRTGPRPRKSTKDREAPMEQPTASTPVTGTHAYEVPAPILPMGETAMERAFRLVKT
jgi:hypothetical protein